MNITRTSIAASISAPATKATGLSTSNDPLAQACALTLTDGVADGQANQQWHARRTLAASATESLDLSGSLRDAFGDAVAFARVKAILLRNDSATGTLTLGGGSNAFVGWFGSAGETITLRPGGFLLIACADAAGYAVTNASADLLRLHNNDSANPLTYELVLVGTT
ncbi:MAG: hypothetical protein NTW19_02530 [Planctomycetota bacterium]|nr:hypothetical protein [Planctomycetota bacterium]